MPGDHEKRDFERHMKYLRKNVDNKYKNKHYILWGGAGVINTKGDFEGVTSFGPSNTPIHDFLNSPEIIAGLQRAAEETYYTMFDEESQAHAHEGNQAQENNQDQNNDQNEPVLEVHLKNSDLAKPPKPVMDLTMKEMQPFFTKFIDSVFDKEKFAIVQK